MVDYGNYRWLQYNTIIDNTELDLKEKGLLLVMFRYVNYEKGYADPSRTLIKKLTGIKHNNTLDKIFNSLIDKGVLIRESGKGGRSKYFIKVGGEITTNTKVVPSEKAIPVEDKDRHYLTSKVPNIPTKNTNTILNKNNIYSDFEKEIISLYPGKKIKAARDKKLPKILKDYGKEQIKRCVERYAKECKDNKAEKQFILNESTWWNGRYLDYLDENYKIAEEQKPKEKVITEEYLKELYS